MFTNGVILYLTDLVLTKISKLQVLWDKKNKKNKNNLNTSFPPGADRKRTGTATRLSASGLSVIREENFLA